MKTKEWANKVCAVTAICALGGIFGGAASRISVELENGKSLQPETRAEAIDWDRVNVDAGRAGHALGWFGLVWAPLALSGLLSGRKPSP